MRETKHPYWHFALIATLVLITFARSLGNDFVWDDIPVIVANPVFDGTHSLVDILAAEDTIQGPGPATGYYRPLTYLTFYVDRLLWGLNPAGFHATSLVVHIGVALALYALLSSLCAAGFVPLIGTLLFALNPVVVEAVCLATARNTLLCALFVLLAVIMQRRGRTAPAVACTLAAAASKELGFLVPFILMAHDFIIEGKLRKWGSYAIHLLPLAGLLVIRSMVVSHGPSPAIISGAALLLAPELVLRYLAVIVMPLTHKVAYEIVTPSVFSLRFVMAMAGCGVIAALMVRLRANRTIFFGLAWFLIFLTPALILAPQYKIPMADRHAYLPALGVALIAAGLLTRVAGRRQTFLPLGVAAVFAGMSFADSGVWRSNQTLFERMVHDAPRAETGYTQLAKHYLDSGSLERALTVLDRGVTAGAVPAGVARNIRLNMLCTEGERLVRDGRDAEAARLFGEALRVAPDFVPALIDMGGVLARRGDAREAARLFSRAVELQPENPVPRFNLSEVYRMLGDDARADAEMREYRRLSGER